MNVQREWTLRICQSRAGFVLEIVHGGYVELHDTILGFIDYGYSRTEAFSYLQH